MSYVALDLRDLALAALLVLVNGLISIAMSLGLARQLWIAAVRMVVQLLVIALVLTWLFERASLPWTAALALVMVLFAGHEIRARQQRPLSGWWGPGLGLATMLVAGTAVTLLGLATQIRPDPWYDPRYAIPLLGMLLGNAMTGISLGLNTLTLTVARERAAIEARLALGAPRAIAFAGPRRDALRTALMPLVNSMAATGVVFLPGMMTGQIFAGVPPVEAVKYQLLVMFLIAGATGLGSVMAVLLAAWRLSDDRHRLRLDRLAHTGSRDS